MDTSCPKCAEPTSRHRPSDGCPYNGWANYETWAVNLWIGNEESSYRYWQDVAQEAYQDAGDGLSAYAKFTGREIFSREERAALALADQLKEDHEEQAQERTGEASVFTDLLNGALSEVNWREIATSLMEEVEKEATDGSE